jgi:hypothetical protein
VSKYLIETVVLVPARPHELAKDLIDGHEFVERNAAQVVQLIDVLE